MRHLLRAMGHHLGEAAMNQAERIAGRPIAGWKVALLASVSALVIVLIGWAAWERGQSAVVPRLEWDALP